jgi:DNA-binding NarL/FixJ family response regulator
MGGDADDALVGLTRRVRASAVELHAAMSELRALAGLPERRDLLTHRQGEVCALVARGLTNSQIASRLGLSERTVRKHLEDSFARTGCTSRTALALWWRSAGMVAEAPLTGGGASSAS